MKPIPANFFGCVVCTELLEHVAEPYCVLAEIHRVLIPGGLLILTVPLGVSIHEKEEQPDYWRFTPSGIGYLLRKRFTNVSVEFSGEVSTPLNVFAKANK